MNELIPSEPKVHARTAATDRKSGARVVSIVVTTVWIGPVMVSIVPNPTVISSVIIVVPVTVLAGVAVSVVAVSVVVKSVVVVTVVVRIIVVRTTVAVSVIPIPVVVLVTVQPAAIGIRAVVAELIVIAESQALRPRLNPHILSHPGGLRTQKTCTSHSKRD